MVVGFDVHHSGKGRNSISIGAMVATTNQSFSQFFTVVSNCKEKKSLAEDMAGLLIRNTRKKCVMAGESNYLIDYFDFRMYYYVPAQEQ